MRRTAGGQLELQPFHAAILGALCRSLCAQQARLGLVMVPLPAAPGGAGAPRAPCFAKTLRSALKARRCCASLAAPPTLGAPTPLL